MAKLGEQMSVSPRLRDLLVEIGEQRTLEAVLQTVVKRLAEQDIALVRIWLVRPGDICRTCPMRAECPDRRRCLHLVASAGHPRAAPDAQWDRTDGLFRRFPIGVRKVGRIAAKGECLGVPNIEEDASWIVNPEWARAEGIVGFSGQPLVFKGEILGVLAVFARHKLTQGCMDWLRMIADLAAASIANARAYEEIDSLRAQLQLENQYLREEVSEARAFGSIIGSSTAIRNIGEQIDLVAPTDANVLILGESGTGKELVAQEIHRRSGRSEAALVRVNCASVPRELYESEFFGHARGAFTGAVRDRTGRFELANGGTLFLDEVGEIPLELQGKLLRVIQEGTYERVGDDRTRSANVRIIAATNRDLKREVDAGRFRQDLYFRLNVFPIEVPPLRERKEDIVLLARDFLRRAEERFRRPTRGFDDNHLRALQAYAWPGNVRELMNVIDRGVIASVGGRLRLDLPKVGRSPERSRNGEIPQVVPQAEIKKLEAENIRAALAECGGRIHGPGGAAELLGMRPTTLASRINRMGLDKRDAAKVKGG